MASFDADELFRQADEARREEERAGPGGESEDDDENEDVCTEEPTITVDATGDIHVCFGPRCPHVVLDRENNWVCHISGRVVGNEYAREQDPSWTGRCTGSANPDDSAGTPVGGWSKRRDMYAASVAAFRSAHAVSDAEVAPQPMRQPASGAAAAKRGALCVDETAVEPQQPKRPRASRRDSWTRDAIAKLAQEAHGVIDKLFIVHAPASSAPKRAPLDPRLQNLDFVRPLALRKYVNACGEGRQALDLNTLTDVLIHANEFVRGQRSLAAQQMQEAATAAKQRKASKACLSGQVRNLLAQLIVSLWRAACLTKHFQTAKKGSDSFRPFAAGILYSLKRGLYLADGTCAVPALDELAKHLPALRSASSTAAAKQLQSSSHRGICSIQRSLASIAEMTPEEARPAMQLLRDAARQGAFLREMVSRNS